MREINALEQSPDWSSTAVIVNYDDSDGWYDHVYSGVTNPSLSPADNLTNTVLEGTIIGAAEPDRRSSAARSPRPPQPLAGEQGRCGFGPRLPLLAHLAVREAERGRPQPERPGLDHQLHRVQLAPARDRGLVRPDSRPIDAQEGVPFDLAGLFDFKAPPNDTPYILNPSTGEPAGP